MDNKDKRLENAFHVFRQKLINELQQDGFPYNEESQKIISAIIAATKETEKHFS